MKHVFGTALVAGAIVAGSASADIIASQNFEGGPGDSYGFGSSIALGSLGGTQVFDVVGDLRNMTAAASGDFFLGAGNLGSANVVDVSFDSLDLTNYEDVVVTFSYYNSSFDQESSDYVFANVNGVETRVSQMGTTGTDVLGEPPLWVTRSIAIGDVDTLDLGFRMRIVGTADHAGIDNIVVTGTAVPTPGSAALLALGGLVGTRRRRA